MPSSVSLPVLAKTNVGEPLNCSTAASFASFWTSTLYFSEPTQDLEGFASRDKSSAAFRTTSEWRLSKDVTQFPDLARFCKIVWVPSNNKRAQNAIFR
jgi:hypothetical protein